MGKEIAELETCSKKNYTILQRGNNVTIRWPSHTHVRFSLPIIKSLADKGLFLSFTMPNGAHEDNCVAISENITHIPINTLASMSIEESLIITLKVLIACRRFYRFGVHEFLPEIEIFKEADEYRVALCPVFSPLSNKGPGDSAVEHLQSSAIQAISALLGDKSRHKLKYLWIRINSIIKKNDTNGYFEAEVLTKRMLILFRISNQISAFFLPSNTTLIDAAVNLILEQHIKQIQEFYYLIRENENKKLFLRLIGDDGQHFEILANEALYPLLKCFNRSVTFSDSLHSAFPPKDNTLASANDFSPDVKISFIGRSKNLYEKRFSALSDKYQHRVIEFKSISISSLKNSIRNYDILDSRSENIIYNIISSYPNIEFSDFFSVITALHSDNIIIWSTTRQRFEVSPSYGENYHISDLVSVMRFTTMELELLKLMSAAEIPFSISTLTKLLPQHSPHLFDIVRRLCSRGVLMKNSYGFYVATESYKNRFQNMLMLFERKTIYTTLSKLKIENIDAMRLLYSFRGQTMPRIQLLRNVSYFLENPSTSIGIYQLAHEIVAALTESDWNKCTESVYTICKAALAIFIDNADGKCVDHLYEMVARFRPHSPLSWSSFVFARIDFAKRKQDYQAALDIGIDYLAVIGFRLPKHPLSSRLLVSYLQTRAHLKAKQMTGWSLSPMKDDKDLTITATMGHVAAAAYMTDSNLFLLLCSLSVRHCLDYGYAPEHAHAFAGFSFLCHELGQRRSFFGSLADSEHTLRLSKNLLQLIPNAELYDSRVRLIEYGFIRHWIDDPHQSVRELSTAYDCANRASDTEYALYAAAIRSCLQLAIGARLQEVDDLLQLPLFQAKSFGQSSSASILHMISQLVALLSGREMLSMVAVAPCLKSEFKRELESHDNTVRCVYLLLKLLIAVIFRRDAEAVELSIETQTVIPAIQGQQLSVFYAFLSAWALTRQGSTSSVHRKLLRSHRQLIRSRSRTSLLCSECFLPALDALAGNPRDESTLIHFEAARKFSEKNGHYLFCALITEQQACVIYDFQRAESDALKRYAARAYETWGAPTKARDLSANISHIAITNALPRMGNLFPQLVTLLNGAFEETNGHASLYQNLLSALLDFNEHDSVTLLNWTPIDSCVKVASCFSTKQPLLETTCFEALSGDRRHALISAQSGRELVLGQALFLVISEKRDDIYVIEMKKNTNDFYVLPVGDEAFSLIRNLMSMAVKLNSLSSENQYLSELTQQQSTAQRQLSSQLEKCQTITTFIASETKRTCDLIEETVPMVSNLLMGSTKFLAEPVLNKIESDCLELSRRLPVLENARNLFANNSLSIVCIHKGSPPSTRLDRSTLNILGHNYAEHAYERVLADISLLRCYELLIVHGLNQEEASHLSIEIGRHVTMEDKTLFLWSSYTHVDSKLTSRYHIVSSSEGNLLEVIAKWQVERKNRRFVLHAV